MSRGLSSLDRILQWSLELRWDQYYLAWGLLHLKLLWRLLKLVLVDLLGLLYILDEHWLVNLIDAIHVFYRVYYNILFLG